MKKHGSLASKSLDRPLRASSLDVHLAYAATHHALPTHSRQPVRGFALPRLPGGERHARASQASQHARNAHARTSPGRALAGPAPCQVPPSSSPSRRLRFFPKGRLPISTAMACLRQALDQRKRFQVLAWRQVRSWHTYAACLV